MVAPGAKGSFPSSTDDATNPTNIIPLSNPHTRTTGFQGTRIRMAEPPGDEERPTITAIILGNPRHIFEKIVLVMTVKAVSDRDFEDCCVAAFSARG